MMGIQNGQPELFSYQINLDRRIWANNLLRAFLVVPEGAIRHLALECDQRVPLAVQVKETS